MTTLADQLKPIIDDTRSIAGELGFRQFEVYAIKIEWSGERPGMGTKSETVKRLLVGKGKNPKVKEVNDRQIIASGGLYSLNDLEVTLTASYGDGYEAGGVSLGVLDPEVSDKATEVLFKVKGPGMPTNGAYYKKISQSTVDSVLTYKIIIRSIGSKGA